MRNVIAFNPEPMEIRKNKRFVWKPEVISCGRYQVKVWLEEIEETFMWNMLWKRWELQSWRTTKDNMLYGLYAINNKELI